ncbi:MAG TPA: ABC transporter ATP-binding protein, partial [Bdellovibrionales bacterium]|nr:ABC transporter ATP-binding protein [Bdellovibrionales bacterium]
MKRAHGGQTRELLSFLAAYTNGSSRLLLVMGFCGLVFSAASVFDIVILKYFFDTVAATRDEGAFMKAFAVFFAVSLAQFAAVYQYRRLESHLKLSVANSIRADFYGAIQRVSLDFFLSRHTGALVNQLATETAAAEKGIQALSGIYSRAVVFFALFTILASLDLRLAAGATALVTAVALVSNRMLAKSQSLARDSQSHRARVQSAFLESIAGGRVIRVFGLEESVGRSFAALLRLTLSARVRLVRHQARATLTGQALILAGLAALVYWRHWGSESFSIGVFLAEVAAIRLLIYPVSELLTGFSELKELSGTTSRLRETLAAEPSVKDEGRAELAGPVESLELERVGFTYPGAERPVFSHVSLKASRGDVVAIVGPNGAGKSTLLNLLPRFYDPTEGR